MVNWEKGKPDRQHTAAEQTKQRAGQEVLPVFISLKTRVWFDFRFLKEMGSLDEIHNGELAWRYYCECLYLYC